MKTEPSTKLVYPSLQAMLDRSDCDLPRYRRALLDIARYAYGHRHILLPASQRRDRLTLYKLINLVERLSLVDDVDVFELGFRCPEQLLSYRRSLMASISRAQKAGADLETLRVAQKALKQIELITKEVTAFYFGLS